MRHVAGEETFSVESSETVAKPVLRRGGDKKMEKKLSKQREKGE